MSVYDEKQEDLERYEFMMGVPRGRLAVSMDLLTDALAFVGQHGSWNRKPASGYKVIFVPFAAGKPAGDPIDVLTGFLDQDGNALGRPVGVTLDKSGALLVADDVGNRIWRVSAAKPQQAER